MRAGVTAPARGAGALVGVSTKPCATEVPLLLQLLARLEADRLPGRDVRHLARAWVAPHAALARFDDEDAKPAQLDALAAPQGLLHRLEERFDRLLRLHLRNASALGNIVNDIDLDHRVFDVSNPTREAGPSVAPSLEWD